MKTYTPRNHPQGTKPLTWGLDARSFVVGIGFALFGGIGAELAGAFNFAEVAKSVSSLVSIKKNLDSDVKLLTADAKKLLGSKDKLLQIKDKLLTLAKDTKSQVDSVQALVSEVEGQLKATESNIATTATHVNEIDKVRKALGGS